MSHLVREAGGGPHGRPAFCRSHKDPCGSTSCGSFCFRPTPTLVIIGLAIGFSFAGFAQDRGRLLAPTLVFKIPSQPLMNALQAYSAVANVDIIYETGIEEGRMSDAVEGEFTREAALKVLLGDNHLVIRYARADAISLLDPKAPAADQPPSTVIAPADMALETLHVPVPKQNTANREALAIYVGTIQADIQEALKKTPTTRGANFRVGLNLWVDASRAIRKAEIFRSTGSSDRDAAISAALEGLVFRQAAPPNTPQPVRVMVTVSAM